MWFQLNLSVLLGALLVKTAYCQALAPSLSIDFESGDVTHYEDGEFLYEFNGTFVKRTDVKDCAEMVINGIGAFSDAASAAAAAWYSAFASCAGSIHDQSNDHNCGVVHAVLNNNFKYIYSASGSGCDTTAQENTIKGPLSKAYKNYVHNNYNGIWCMDLPHGGTWVGYLLVGPNASKWPNSISCGSNNSGQCVSGGVNDVHKK